MVTSFLFWMTSSSSWMNFWSKALAWSPSNLSACRRDFLDARASFLPTSSLTPSVRYNPLIHIITSCAIVFTGSMVPSLQIYSVSTNFFPWSHLPEWLRFNHSFLTLTLFRVTLGLSHALFSSPHSASPTLLSRPKINTSLADGSVSSRRK